MGSLECRQKQSCPIKRGRTQCQKPKLEGILKYDPNYDVSKHTISSDSGTAVGRISNQEFHATVCKIKAGGYC